jgi:hypothetical protein
MYISDSQKAQTYTFAANIRYEQLFKAYNR